MIKPKTTPRINNKILYSPSALNESLSKIVEIINPVFLINCEYLSVYWKEINNINRMNLMGVEIRIEQYVEQF